MRPWLIPDHDQHSGLTGELNRHQEKLVPSCINVLTESEVLASHPASVPLLFTEHCNMHCFAPDTCP